MYKTGYDGAGHVEYANFHNPQVSLTDYEKVGAEIAENEVVRGGFHLADVALSLYGLGAAYKTASTIGKLYNAGKMSGTFLKVNQYGMKLGRTLGTDAKMMGAGAVGAALSLDIYYETYGFLDSTNELSEFIRKDNRKRIVGLGSSLPAVPRRKPKPEHNTQDERDLYRAPEINDTTPIGDFPDRPAGGGTYA